MTHAFPLYSLDDLQVPNLDGRRNFGIRNWPKSLEIILEKSSKRVDDLLRSPEILENPELSLYYKKLRRAIVDPDVQKDAFSHILYDMLTIGPKLSLDPNSTSFSKNIADTMANWIDENTTVCAPAALAEAAVLGAVFLSQQESL